MLVQHFREQLAFGEALRTGQWILAEKKQELNSNKDSPCGGGLLYEAVVVFTMTWHAAKVKPTFSYTLFLSTAGIGSLIIWWRSVSLAVTVNEHRWFVGEYGTLIIF